MKEKYIVDTSFIIGLALKKDKHHTSAIKQKDKLKKPCFINNAVLNETVTLTYHKTHDLQITNTIYYIISDLFSLINEYEIENYNNKVLNVFNRNKGQLSFTDAGIIVTSREHNIPKILTFDKALKK